MLGIFVILVTFSTGWAQVDLNNLLEARERRLVEPQGDIHNEENWVLRACKRYPELSYCQGKLPPQDAPGLGNFVDFGRPPLNNFATHCPQYLSQFLFYCRSITTHQALLQPNLFVPCQIYFKNCRQYLNNKPSVGLPIADLPPVPKQDYQLQAFPARPIGSQNFPVYRGEVGWLPPIPGSVRPTDPRLPPIPGHVKPDIVFPFNEAQVPILPEVPKEDTAGRAAPYSGLAA